MVEDCHCHRVQVRQADPKQPEGPGDGVKIEVRQAQAQHILWQLQRLIVADQLDAHLRHLFQVIVERARRGRGGVHRQTGFEMRFCRPLARPAAHGHAVEQHGLPPPGRLLELPVHHHGRGGHHQLEAVLQVQARIVEQDILRAGTDVNGEDFHREKVYHRVVI